jgi:hypothetical protein
MGGVLDTERADGCDAAMRRCDADGTTTYGVTLAQPIHSRRRVEGEQETD